MRLRALREVMMAHRLDGWVVLQCDPHNSEYVADSYQRRAFISGFTGSAGSVLVTQAAAHLWTDGRYWTQAERELVAEDWQLHKTGTLEAFVAAEFTGRLGCNTTCMPLTSLRLLQDALRGARRSGEVEVVAFDDATDAVDVVWGDARPPHARAPIVEMPDDVAGESTGSKLQRVGDLIRGKKAAYAAISALDAIAWLTNLRGGDVQCNPVFFAHAIVLASPPPPPPSGDAAAAAATTVEPAAAAVAERAVLYVGDAASSRLPEAAERRLAAAGWAVRPYAQFCADLAARAAAGAVALIDPAGVSARTAAAVGADAREAACGVAALKAVKNAAELAGMRAAHVRDGAALTAFLAWLDAGGRLGTAAAASAATPCAAFAPPADGRWAVRETAAADELEAWRRALGGDSFRGLSFPTIAGEGPNGAVIHYQAVRGDSREREVAAARCFLVDSGGQYHNGTTDVTRTVWVRAGTPPSALEPPPRRVVEAYTAVLRGHVALASAVFPAGGTTGLALDALARQHLWRLGLNYDHGTGHGVGHHLCVHEAPPRIGPISANAPVAAQRPLEVGHVVSNEPGYYLPDGGGDGGFGIRIESLVEVRRAATPHAHAGVFGNGEYLEFDTITLAPLERRLIDTSALLPHERRWVDEYHARVRVALEPLLAAIVPAAVPFLHNACAPLE